MPYELTKVLGPIDFSGLRVTEKLLEQFIERGHLTILDPGDAYLPKDIVGEPLLFCADRDGKLLLYSKIFDGPDLNAVKAQRLGQILKQQRQQYSYSAVLGRTADKQDTKLRVGLVPTVQSEQALTILSRLELNVDLSPLSPHEVKDAIDALLKGPREA